MPLLACTSKGQRSFCASRGVTVCVDITHNCTLDACQSTRPEARMDARDACTLGPTHRVWKFGRSDSPSNVPAGMNRELVPSVTCIDSSESGKPTNQEALSAGTLSVLLKRRGNCCRQRPQCDGGDPNILYNTYSLCRAGVPVKRSLGRSIKFAP